MADEGVERGSVLKRLPKPALIATAGTLLLFVILTAAAFEPFVRSQVQRRAAARGLDVSVGEVDLGRAGVWLKDVSVTAKAMPSLKVELDAVFVPLTSSPIEVHGGDVLLRGTYSEVSEQWSRFRKPASPAKAASGGGTDYAVDGLNLSWTGLAGGASHRGWGLNYTRAPGQERVSAQLARLSSDGLSLEVHGFETELARSDKGRTISRVTARGASLDVDLERFGLVRPPDGAEPGPTRPASAPESRLKLPLVLATIREQVRRVFVEHGRIEVPSASARLRTRADTLNFGPSRLLVERQSGALTALLEPGNRASPDATPLSLRATLPLLAGEPELEVAGGPVSLSVLGVRDGDFGLFDVKQASIEAQTKLTLLAGPKLRLSGSAKVQNVSLSRKALSPVPLRNLRLSLRGSAEAALDGSRFDVTDAELSVGDVRFQGSGLLERGSDFLRVNARGGVPLGACEKLLEAVPEGFAPSLAGLRMSGTFAASFVMDVNTRELDRMKVELDVQNACKITHVPEPLHPSRFQGPWWRTVTGADDQPVGVESGPGSRNWIRYEDISKHMETAVIVCEDGGFYRHGGFDYRAIEKSIQDNVRAGRFVRGASTISMQLAKNLYLGKEKTLSRKFEEAILTMLLEQSFEKRELMELYLNVIEFGPGIYGIGPAARHYFNVEPHQLTLGQALYLASILPSPDRHHFDEDGLVSERWTKYLRKLMYIAYKISRIDDEELAAGLEEEVAFRVPGAEPPAYSDELAPLPPLPLEPLVDDEPLVDEEQEPRP